MTALTEEDETQLADNIIRAVFTFYPPINTSEHIIEKTGYGKVINTNVEGGVLLGKMSFQITASEEEEFTTDWFSLVPDTEHSPNTGIKINLDITTYYQKQSTFRFTKQFTGTLIGEIFKAPTAEKNIHKAMIRAYPVNKVKEILDWDTVLAGKVPDDVHDRLLTLQAEEIETNDDGTYELSLPPGIYDVLIDSPGYLDQIYIQVEVTAGKTKDLGYVELLAGDINKDGKIEIEDIGILMKMYGINDIDTDYEEKYDFNDDKKVEIEDVGILMKNYLKIRNIQKGVT